MEVDGLDLPVLAHQLLGKSLDVSSSPFAFRGDGLRQVSNVLPFVSVGRWRKVVKKWVSNLNGKVWEMLEATK